MIPPEPKNTVIKTDQGYISVNYPSSKTPSCMFTLDMIFAKRYTERGARAIIAKLGFGKTQPWVQPKPTDEDIEWMNEIIERK